MNGRPLEPATIFPPGPSLAGRDWRIWALAVGIIVLLFALLHNSYWSPSGDGEVYASIARNLARAPERGESFKQAYRFNGQPVAMVPPGWPVVLAAAMRVSPEMGFLKLVAMSCLVGFLAVQFWIARRLGAGAWTAAGVVVLSAMISHLYPMTYWLISDGLFCLLLSGAVLLAMRLGDDPDRPRWRDALLAAAMIALCAAAVTVRWAGILGWAMVAAALIGRAGNAARSLRWTTVFVSLIVTLAVFFAWRGFLGGQLTPEQIAEVKQFGGAAEEAAAAQPDDAVSRGYSLLSPASPGAAGYVARFLSAGRWIAWLFFQPLRVENLVTNLIAAVAGWTLLAGLAFVLVSQARAGRWIWLGVAIYFAALVMRWHRPNARYLAPVAPMLLLGIVLAGRSLCRCDTPWRRRMAQAALGAFVGSVLLVNGTLYAIEASIARSENYYARYEAGMVRPLIAIAEYLRGVGADSGRIGVTQWYDNLGRKRRSPFPLRALNFLTDRAIVNVPDLNRHWRSAELYVPPNPELHQWALDAGLRYYVYQPPISPWRVWHFRPAWLQRWIEGVDPPMDPSDWQLWRIDPDGMSRVPVSPMNERPARVYGI